MTLVASHTMHRLQTTLNVAQEELVLYLRTLLLRPLNDLLAMMREFIEPSMSQSALDRLLHRRGHFSLPITPKPDGEHKPFKADVHIDVKYLPQMPDEDKCRYVAMIGSPLRKLPQTTPDDCISQSFLAAVRNYSSGTCEIIWNPAPIVGNFIYYFLRSM